MDGTATSYDIRYSTVIIDGSNWDSATQVTAPTPAAPTTSQSVTIGSLTNGTTYYFAMKTSDEVPNTSALSNVVGGTTVAIPPVVQFTASSSNGSEGTTPATITVTLDKTWPQTVVVNYAVTGGTATEGSDYTIPATGGNAVVALKRDATLTAGGVLSTQFTTLTDSNAVLTTIKDARLYQTGNGQYMNYGTTVQATGAPPYVLVGFDLSAYAGATINKAQLRVRCSAGNTSMLWAPVKSHSWTEGTKNGDYPGADPAAEGVCWAHPNGLYTTAAGTPGWGSASDSMFSVTSDGDDIYALANFDSAPGGAAWCVTDITSLVQDWIATSKPNYGIFINAGNHPVYLSEYGADYQPVLFLDADLPNQQLRFAPGETSKTISLPIIDDSAAEANETIELTLSSPVNATLGSQSTFTYTIVDNENQAPTVNAGNNQTITLPADATLSGSANDDGLPNPPGAVTTTWSKVSGPGTVTFADANAASTTATFSAAGTYALQLLADDSALTSTATCTITVNPGNTAPTVNAGSDQAITLPTDTVNLDGTVNDDGLPNPPAAVTVTWSKVSGPGTVTFADASAVDTTATFGTDGTYVLQLEASDSALTASASCTVTVTPASPPASGDISLTYLGAFEVGSVTNVYGGGLTFYPSGNSGAGSLFISRKTTGGDAEIYEVAIPTLVNTTDITLLNSVTPLQGFDTSSNPRGLAWRSTDDKLYYSTGGTSPVWRSIDRDGTNESAAQTSSAGAMSVTVFANFPTVGPAAMPMART